MVVCGDLCHFAVVCGRLRWFVVVWGGLRWFAVVCLIVIPERNHICAKSLRLEVSGRMSRGRPKKRWRDNIQGDMKKYQLTEDMAQDRKYWITKILAGPAQGDGQERYD